MAKARLGLLLLPFAVFSCAHFFLHASYNSNDDVGIRLLLEGRLTPGAMPSAEIFLMNLDLGRGLVSLYRRFPEFYWYDAFNHTVLALAFSTNLRLLQLAGGSIAARAGFLCMAYLAVFAQPQFTVVAILASGTGVLCAGIVVFGRFGVVGTMERIALAAAGSALIIAGLFIRLEAGALAATFTALCTFVLVTTMPTVWKRTWREVLIACAILLAAGGATAKAWIDHYEFYSRSPAWAQFYAFNALRAANTEYARITPSRPGNAVQVPGSLSRDDHEALRWSVYFDPNVFSVAKLAHGARAAQASKILHVDPAMFIRQFVKSVILIAPVELFIAGLMLRSRHRRYIRAALICSGIFLINVIFIQLLFKTLPWRVIWPTAMLQFAIFACFWPAAPAIQSRLERFGGGLMAAATALTLVIIVTMSALYSRAAYAAAVDTQRADLRDAMATISLEDAIQITNLERPFESGPIQRDYPVITLGMMTRSPVVMSQLQQWSAKPLEELICGTKGVVIIGVPQAIDALRLYYRNHRAAVIKLNLYYKGKTFNAYTCIIQSPAK